MKKGLLLAITATLFCFVSSALAVPYTGADIELTADQYNSASIYTENSSGKWISGWKTLSDGSIYTAWANQKVTYTVDLSAGNWNIGLNAINHGNLDTGWYSSFSVARNDGTPLFTLIISASDTEVNSGYYNIDLLAGLYTVTYTWLNDKYDPSNGLDANIQITSVFFDNIATAPVPEPGTLMLLGAGLAGLAGLGFYRRKRMK